MMNHPRYVRALNILSNELQLTNLTILRDPTEFSHLYDYFECLRYLGKKDIPASLNWPDDGFASASDEVSTTGSKGLE